MSLPEESVLREVVERYARLASRLGGELGRRPMVLPDAASFPDVFSPDLESLAVLVERMLEHAGMEDIPVGVALGGDDPAAQSGGCCGGGACAAPSASAAPRVAEEGDGWLLTVPAGELTQPTVLTANLARALALIFLMETRDEREPLEAPLDVTVDLTAVALGFGALVLEGAYIYAKSCGGPRVSSVTALGVSELAVALTLFAGAGEHPLKHAKRHLGATQLDALGEASTWLQSNPRLVERLRSDPAALARGEYTLDGAKPWLLRAIARQRGPAAGSFEELEASLARGAALRPASGAAGPDDELARLVAEELEVSR